MESYTNASVDISSEVVNSSSFPTNSTPPLSAKSVYSYPELVFCAVMSSILVVWTLIGNSLVLVAVARTKKLQNITNVFVVNLSVSDCLAGLAFLWSVPGMVSTTPGYPLQTDVPCIIAAAVTFMSVPCGLNTLANIALNRCILITRPMETYQWMYTPKKIALMVLGSWLVPLCATILPPLTGIGDLGFDPESRTCSDVDTHPKASTFDKIQFAIFYPIPSVVILVSYVLIWRYVKKHFRKRRRRMSERLQSSTGMQTAPSSISRFEVDDSTATRSRTQQLSTSSKHDQLAITKNLFVVVLAFVVCFTPLSIMVVTKSQRYQLYGALVVFLSGCLNPLIYAAKHPHFAPVLRPRIRCRSSPE